MEELLVERGVDVEHAPVVQWVQRFLPLLADAARFARRSPGDRWFVDKTYVKVSGVWRYVYRAIDQDGQPGCWVRYMVRNASSSSARVFTAPRPDPGAGRVSSAASCNGRAAPTMTAMAIAETANVRESVRESSWPRVTVGLMGVGLAILVLVAALGLPASDPTVWAEAALTAVSAVALAALVWWLTRPGGVPDRRLVLDRGLGSGLVLGGLWMAEIGFNNLAPPEVSTASSRGVVDNVTWAIVGVVTVAVVVLVTARTRRWRSGLRAGVWSGVGSGLGAGLGGALLLAFLRDFVVRDPLMQAEHIERAPGVEVATYVTRETMAGIFGHLWVLGIVQGALLAVVAATVTAAVIGSGRRRGKAGHDVG